MRFSWLCAILLGAFAAVEAYTVHEEVSLFTSFMKEYGKSYNAQEMPHRLRIFKSNLKRIQENNMDPTSTMQMGVTQFADLTSDEFIRYYSADPTSALPPSASRGDPAFSLLEADSEGELMGSALSDDALADLTARWSRPPRSTTAPAVSAAPAAPAAPAVPGAASDAGATVASTPPIVGRVASLYPDDMEMDHSGNLGAVRAQSKCNSSWAIVATEFTEWFHKGVTGKTVRLSPQEVIDCADMGVPSTHPNKDLDCSFGNPVDGMRYLHRHGAARHDTYTYKNAKGKCQNTTHAKVKAIHPIALIMANNDPRYSIRPQHFNTQLAVNSPISVLTSIEFLQLYKSGIVSCRQPRPRPGEESKEPWPTRQSRQTQHMLVVGFGYKGDFPVYKVRTSLGTKWGENGYYYYPRNTSLVAPDPCGLMGSRISVFAPNPESEKYRPTKIGHSKVYYDSIGK